LHACPLGVHVDGNTMMRRVHALLVVLK
jgi:hypothetical protein